MAVATKSWVTAQLRLLGIEFKPTDPKKALWDALEAAFKSKKCQKPPPEVEAIKESLRQKYAASLTAHSHEIKLWEDHEFAEQAQFGPSAEFFADNRRFLNKYFLDSNRKPDRSKTAKPLLLLNCSEGTVKSAIYHIPGLVAHGWNDCRTRVRTLLGWETEMDKAVEHEFSKVASSTPPNLTGAGPEDYDIATTEANIDMKRFLQKYFPVDRHGTASAKKSSTPMRLLP